MAIQDVERRQTIKRTRELLMRMLDEVEKGKNWDRKVEVVKLVTMFNLMVARVALMKPNRRKRELNGWEALRQTDTPIQDKAMRKLYNEFKIEVKEAEKKLLEKSEEEEELIDVPTKPDFN